VKRVGRAAADTSYGSFGHVGNETAMGIGDPVRDLATLFLTMASRKPSGDNTRRLRTTVRDRMVAAVEPGPHAGLAGRPPAERSCLAVAVTSVQLCLPLGRSGACGRAIERASDETSAR